MPRLAPLVALVFFPFLAALAFAGQGAQNVAIVVNLRSPLSLAVAHRYAELRQVPTSNLIYLDWDQAPVGTDVETFREKILKPIFRMLDERGLTQQITTIAYSADFPYVIDYKADLQEDSKVDPTAKQFHQGSLTGLTYLANFVLAKDVSRYTNLGSNLYFRNSLGGKLLQETRDFPPNVGWNSLGEPSEDGGPRYWLSTMLAYTSGRGNSYAEVQRYLESSLRADGTYPAGKIYYLTNSDVRARTREPQFKSAVSLLERLGVAAQVIDGVLPREKSDIMGAMIGTVDYRFADSGSTVHGGAICENLTSFGGIMRENGGQTALSECLRAGAAGSSGTVTEPYAIQAKFPHPLIHVHYARGCCLAEAFYQAVQGPYQLLIVGDPLARPWATIPTVTVAGLPDPEKPVTGEVTLTPSASTVAGKGIKRFELFLDGKSLAQCAPGEKLSLNAAKELPKGTHELRVVAYEDSLVATQGVWVQQVKAAEPTNTSSASTQLAKLPTGAALPALEPVGETKPGLRLLRDGELVKVVDRLADDWLAKAEIKPGEAIAVEGLFRVPQEDLYQFQLDHSGKVQVEVDGQKILDLAEATRQFSYGVVRLAPGMHRLEIRTTVDNARRLNVAFGNCGTQAVADTLLHHVE